MNILYATDGSEGALQGAHALAHLPLGDESEVMIFTVLPQRAHGEGAGQEPLEAARQALTGSHARVTTYVRHGDPAEVILQALEDCPVDLVVVGSRGMSALERFFLGSVAERVVRHAGCPVLVVRRPHADFRRVIVAVDGSDSSLLAVEWLSRFPLGRGSEVRLTTVRPLNESLAHRRPPLLPGDPTGVPQDAMKEAIRWQRQRLAELRSLAVSFEARGLRTVADVRYGDPATVLLQLAEESQTDLIVLGSHGHSAIQRFLLGSVSEKVLRHAHCSVLVVRQPVVRARAATAAIRRPELQGAIG